MAERTAGIHVNAPLCLRSPAKLNLFLHVTGRRDDGYHTLQTVFQLIDLCDEMSFEVSRDAGIVLDSDLPGVDCENNLCMRAARALAQRCSPSSGVRIRLRKRIPAGGGLGGGSSNAATTLLALNRLWECGLGLGELARLGLQLGADVPVFVRGRSAWAEGVGEILTPVDLPERWYLVVRPDCSVNTAAIFADRELTRNTAPMKIAGFLTRGGHNDCEPVVRKRYPQVGEALDWLGRFGEARMSGTGSCIFASFPDEASARAAGSGVPAKWLWFVARGMNRSWVHEALFD